MIILVQRIKIDHLRVKFVKTSKFINRNSAHAGPDSRLNFRPVGQRDKTGQNGTIDLFFHLRIKLEQFLSVHFIGR